MAHMHRLTTKDVDTKTAVCEECGPVEIRFKTSRGYWECREALRRRRRVWKTGHAARTGESTGPREGLCEICTTTTTIYWDHNHQTGVHRGWLCHWCNVMLGWSRDNPATLLRAAAYLSPSPPA